MNPKHKHRKGRINYRGLPLPLIVWSLIILSTAQALGQQKHRIPCECASNSSEANSLYLPLCHSQHVQFAVKSTGCFYSSTQNLCITNQFGKLYFEYTENTNGITATRRKSLLPGPGLCQALNNFEAELTHFQPPQNSFTFTTHYTLIRNGNEHCCLTVPGAPLQTFPSLIQAIFPDFTY